MGLSNPMRWNSIVTAFLLAMLLFPCLFGCSAGQTQGNSDSCPWIQVIDSGIQGVSTGREPSVTWITSPAQLQQMIADFGKQRITKFSASSADIDFDLYRVLLIEMGLKPTGGYSVTLANPAASASDGTAIIRVIWNVPDAGAVLPQVVTSPYLLLRLAKSEYRRVLVVDQENRTLFEMNVPEF